VYLFNIQMPGQQEPPFYASQILRAEALLGLSHKVASTTCSRAYIPLNVTKREMYGGTIGRTGGG
jgi:hypothetical protein